MISMNEIQEMARDAYERGKRDGIAEERERIDSLLETEMIERAGSRWQVDEQIVAVLTELRRAIRQPEHAQRHSDDGAVHTETNE